MFLFTSSPTLFQKGKLKFGGCNLKRNGAPVTGSSRHLFVGNIGTVSITPFQTPPTLPFSVQLKAEERGRETKETQAADKLKKISQVFIDLSLSESKILSGQEVIPGRGQGFVTEVWPHMGFSSYSSNSLC